MKKLFLTIACLLSALAHVAWGQDTTPANRLTPGELVTQERTDLIFEQAKDFPAGTQLALAFLHNGQVHYYGVLRQANEWGTVANQDSVFEIGSITKVFTSTLLAQAVEEGVVNLEDPIDDKLGYSLKKETSITYLQLASHTSGLPRLPSNIMWAMMQSPDNPYMAYNAEKLEKYLTQSLKLNREPGEGYEYSNLGAGILGHTLAQAVGQPYATLLQTQIFDKYGMATATTQRERVAERLVTGRNIKGEPVSGWDWDVLAGAGCILASVTDMAKFGQAQFNASDEALALTRQQTAEVDEGMAIGLGWHIISTNAGGTLHWHNGGTGGYTSSMALDIKQQTGVVVLSNVTALSPAMGNIDTLCFKLMASLEEK